MENEFKGIMSEKSDKELIKIITLDKDKYQPLAIEAVENELKYRNISNLDFENISQNIQIEEEKEKIRENNSVNSGIRFLNFLIDSGLGLAITFILTFSLNANDPIQKLLGYFIIFGVFIFYYVFLELKYQKTIGKMVTKTKVVKYNDERPTKKDIIARTILRFVPFDQISFIFTKNGFHDMLSKTKVIKDEN